jgi:peptide/nickel transport system substrate-binding protein
MSRTRIGALIAATMIVVSACGSSSASPTAAPTAAASAAASTGASTAPSAAPSASALASEAATPVNGGSMVYALQGDMVYADPSIVSDGNSLYVSEQVVQNLVGLKPGTISDIVPVLAASMPTVSADGKTYTFTLHTGVTFSDGTPFNAAAVKFNYDRWKNFPKGDLQDNAYYYGAVFGGFGADSNIASVDAPNDTTVVFTLKNPQSNFLLATTLGVFGIQSPTALQNGKADTTPLSNNNYAQAKVPSMVGTGPFILKEWVPGDHITIVKNPNYWDTANAAHLDQVTFKPIGDTTATLQALQTGAVDGAFFISSNDIAAAQSAGLQIIDRGASCNLGYLGMNQQLWDKSGNKLGGPTIYANKDVRMAVAAALNKQGYIDALYAGQGKVATGFMPPSTIGYKAQNLPAYDVNAAKASLAAANLTPDQLKIDLYYPSNVTRPYMPDPKNEAVAVAGDLTAIGFTVTLKTIDWHAGYYNTMNTGQEGLYLLGWTCDWAGADNFLVTAFFGYSGGQPAKAFGYKNDQMNDLFNKALQAPTVDQANQYWGQAQDLIGADMPMVPIVNSTPAGALSAKVHGYVGASNGTEYLAPVWLQP